MIRTYNGEFLTEAEAVLRATDVEDEADIAPFEMGEIPFDSGQEGNPFIRMIAPTSGMGFGIAVFGDTQHEADAFARAILGRMGL